MDKIVVQLLIVILIFTQQCSPSRILGICPSYAKSHWAFCSSVLKVLGEAGHEVIVVSPYSLPNTTTTSYHNIRLGSFKNASEEPVKTKFDINNSVLNHPIISMARVVQMGVDMVPPVMENEEVQQLMKDPNTQFDLVILEAFVNEALYGFGEHFKAPIIAVFPSVATRMINTAVGNPEDPAYVPNGFSPFADKMNLCQRVYNFILGFSEFIALEVLGHSIQSEMYEKYFKDNRKTLRQVIKQDISLAFINTHFSLSFPRPYVPNMIEIGGINIDKDIKELPEQFKDFLDSANDGVILFSMGSFLQASDFTEDQRMAIINAFGKIKQKVIWRYNLPDTDHLPENILTAKWLPQKEIMAHPNVKLFITHGGMLGTTESVYYGKPMIGIPVLGDQPLNIARAVKRGYALSLDLNNLTESAILAAIEEILNNPKYTDRAQELSRIFRDQPDTPQERVLYWSEYVIRHKGAKHLKVEAQNLDFLAYHGLDVIFIIFLGIIVIFVVPSVVFGKWMLRRITKSKRMSKLKDK